MNENIFTYVMPRKGACASARLVFPEMVILRDSVVAQHVVRSMPAAYRQLRERLIDQGVLAMVSGELKFTRDYRFANSSEAVCVVEGGSRDGYDSWRNAQGQTLGNLGYRR